VQAAIRQKPSRVQPIDEYEGRAVCTQEVGGGSVPLKIDLRARAAQLQ
jgi:hypothetical protein